jgi:polysaccharide export outer membrane protein
MNTKLDQVSGIGKSKPLSVCLLFGQAPLQPAIALTIALMALSLLVGQQTSLGETGPFSALISVPKENTPNLARLSSVPSVSQVATNVHDPKATPTISMDALDDKHRLAIGDRLSFRIEEDQEDPKPLTVTDSGDLELPYIGRFPAENKTCKQLAQEIKVALEKEHYYQATVIIAVDFMSKSRGRVYLVGPVRMPGPLEIPSDEVLTLSKAIMRAGGFNDFADKRNVKVTRKSGASGSDKKTFVVDVAEIFEKGKVERDLPLEPGDLILVPERLIRF